MVVMTLAANSLREILQIRKLATLRGSGEVARQLSELSGYGGVAL